MTGFQRPQPDPDALSAWLDAECDLGPDRAGNARQLWRTWSRFADARPACRGTPRSFSNALRKRGFPSVRLRPGAKTRAHAGLALTEAARRADEQLLNSARADLAYRIVMAEIWVAEDSRKRLVEQLARPPNCSSVRQLFIAENRGIPPMTNSPNSRHSFSRTSP